MSKNNKSEDNEGIKRVDEIKNEENKGKEHSTHIKNEVSGRKKRMNKIFKKEQRWFKFSEGIKKNDVIMKYKDKGRSNVDINSYFECQNFKLY